MSGREGGICLEPKEYVICILSTGAVHLRTSTLFNSDFSVVNTTSEYFIVDFVMKIKFSVQAFIEQIGNHTLHLNVQWFRNHEMLL